MPTRGVIVYLAQARHASYARNSLALLRQSVKLLHKNYNAWARDDVIFFHAPDSNVSALQRAQILALCRPAFARFFDLPRWAWQIPPGAHEPKMPESIKTGPRIRRRQWAMSQRLWVQPRFSPGYRHMIRLFTLVLWDIVANLGYEYVMRMDEDSWLWSPIRYNVFDFMATRGLVYGYRLASWESGNPVHTGTKFHRFVRDYILQNGLNERVARSGWLLAPCLGLDNATGAVGADSYSLERCGNLNGPYNNWFVSSVAFWRSTEVQRFLRHVNQSQLIYYERYNDILWHGTALQIFLPPSAVHLFQDFAYEHITTKIGNVHDQRKNHTKLETCIGYGGLALGNVTGADAHAAFARLVQLRAALAEQMWKAAASKAFFRWCTRETPCFLTEPRSVATSWAEPRTDAALLIGSISIEQPVCERRPEPYHCGLVEARARFVKAIERDNNRRDGPNHASLAVERWQQVAAADVGGWSNVSQGTLHLLVRDRERLRLSQRCEPGSGAAVMRFMKGWHNKTKAELEQEGKMGINYAFNPSAPDFEHAGSDQRR